MSVYHVSSDALVVQPEIHAGEASALLGQVWRGIDQDKEQLNAREAFRKSLRQGDQVIVVEYYFEPDDTPGFKRFRISERGQLLYSFRERRGSGQRPLLKEEWDRLVGAFPSTDHWPSGNIADYRQIHRSAFFVWACLRDGATQFAYFGPLASPGGACGNCSEVAAKEAESARAILRAVFTVDEGRNSAE